MKSKLKMPLEQMFSVGGFLYLLTLILEDQLIGTQYSLYVWIVIPFIWGILYANRTKLLIFIVFGIIASACQLHYVLQRDFNTVLNIGTWLAHLLFLFACVFCARFFIGNHIKLEKNAFKLFQIASQKVFDVSSGFTERPYAAGTLSYKKEEIFGFADFLKDKNIVMPIVKDNQIYLTFSMNTSPVKKPDFKQVSYALFDMEGNLSVSISQKDYRQYKELYSFDQLCLSLAELFEDFLNHYKNGNDNRIIAKMDAAKISLFS